MDTQPAFARLFPDTPGHNEDNGALLDLIIRALPADRLQWAAVAFQALAHATVGVTPAECGQPLTGYRESLETGHIPALEWYWTQDATSADPGKIFRTALPPSPLDGRTAASILASHGHLDALKLARHHGCPWGEVATGPCAYAATHGHLAVLQYARACGCPWDSCTRAMAAACGHLDVGSRTEWAHANGCPRDHHEYEHAARNGHLEVLQWLCDQPLCTGRHTTCAHAAACGHLEVGSRTEWAHAQGHPWNECVCVKAAENGHLGILQWARAQSPPCPWYEGVCATAAGGGRLVILQWLRAQDPPCPWGASSCTLAAENGHLETLQWLRAQDPPCPWDSDTLAMAIDHPAIMQWMRETGYPGQ